jgi:hypothetical protein
MKNKHPTQSEQFQNLMKNKTSHTVRTVPKYNEKQNIPESEQFQNIKKNKTSHTDRTKPKYNEKQKIPHRENKTKKK